MTPSGHAQPINHYISEMGHIIAKNIDMKTLLFYFFCIFVFIGHLVVFDESLVNGHLIVNFHEIVDVYYISRLGKS